MASTYTMVAYGSQGSAVRQLQNELNKRGYSLDQDGIFGKKTRAAVRDYQKKNGLKLDGIAGKETWGSLLAGQTAYAPASTSSGGSSNLPLDKVSDGTAAALKELEKIYIYDKFPESMDRFIEQVADEVKLPIIKASCPEEVVKNCEVLSSAAFIVREPMKLVRKEWIRKGQTILPCDLNTFWDPRIALTASTLWTASTSTSCLPVWAISPTDCRRSPVRPARYWPVSPRAAPARMRSLCAAISASPPMTSPWDRRSSPRLWKWASAPG